MKLKKEQNNCTGKEDEWSTEKFALYQAKIRKQKKEFGHCTGLKAE